MQLAGWRQRSHNPSAIKPVENQEPDCTEDQNEHNRHKLYLPGLGRGMSCAHQTCRALLLVFQPGIGLCSHQINLSQLQPLGL